MTRSGRRGTGIALGWALLCALAIPLTALAVSRDTGKTPSFTKDVAPIIQQKCSGCHQVGGIAPFPLDDARRIARRSSAIAGAVAGWLMPPWPPGPKSPAYAGESERRLTASERATIVAWARAGGRVDGPARRALRPKKPPAQEGESVLELRPQSAYRPRAPKGTTDDYRCFLLDPKLGQDASVTSARIEPDARKVVHHVILFRVPPGQVAEARGLDAADRGQGWTCFGGTGLSLGSSGGGVQESLDDASWVSAWAPGWDGNRLPEGTGVPLSAGSQIVMQVHYNLLNGRAQDRSRAVLTTAPSSAQLKPLRTMLLPGPVELACAKGEHGRLCSRTEALVELSRKYGQEAAFTPAGLLLLCRGDASTPKASAVSTCDRRISKPTTIHVAAGHMHLLGAAIRVELNPGSPRARILLDIPRWDFHWQNAYTLQRPIQARAGDVVRVTCRYDVSKRRHGEHGIPKTPRYILWGEGTTDEMCLGILQVTRG